MKTNAVNIVYTYDIEYDFEIVIIVETKKSKKVFDIRKNGILAVGKFLCYLTELFEEGYDNYHIKNFNGLTSVLDMYNIDLIKERFGFENVYYNIFGVHLTAINDRKSLDLILNHMLSKGGYTCQTEIDIGTKVLVEHNISHRDNKVLPDTIYVLHKDLDGIKTEEETFTIEVVTTNKERKFELSVYDVEGILEFLEYITLLLKQDNRNIHIFNASNLSYALNNLCNMLSLSDEIDILLGDKYINPLLIFNIIDSPDLKSKKIEEKILLLGTGY